VNYGENSPAYATAIALNSTGDSFLTGAIGGQPLFGTNTFGDGPVQSVQAFVARRPTIMPRLRVTHRPDQVILQWPHTALPFVLQANTTLDSNAWTDIAFPQTNGAKRIELPTTGDLDFFRLRSTNEVPINHTPHIFYVKVDMGFLDRTNTAITVSNSAAAIPFAAAVEDEDETDLFFSWWNNETGAALASGASSQRIYLVDGTSFWIARWSDPQTSWSLDMHSLRFTASDGAISVTNVVRFEVITAHDAIGELIAAVQDATSEPETSNLVAPLQLADTALNSADYTAAAGHLDEFKTGLRNSAQLSLPQKSLFEYSADVLKTVFPPSG
jgi:hypothetical protein